jgi:hypothetical protein
MLIRTRHCSSATLSHARFNSLTSVAAIHCLVASVLADQAGSTPLESRMPSHCNSLCTVEGSVFNPATGAPLKKAAVVVNRTDVQPNLNAPPPSYNTTTDAAGKFAMKDIEPGKYRMTVTRSGFVTMTYGARGHRGRTIMPVGRYFYHLPDLIVGGFRHGPDSRWDLAGSCYGCARCTARCGPGTIPADLSHRERHEWPARACAGRSRGAKQDIGEPGCCVFLVTGLPPGDYLLCASVPSAAFLDPCQWATPLRVTVSPNALTTQNIALAKGVFLKVRVNDPLGLLPQTLDGPMLGGKLAVGVYYANNAYTGTTNMGVDGSGRDYQRIVPVGIPLKLWLFSGDVALADASGKPVNSSSGALIPFQATAGQDQVFTFVVSGALAKSL